MIDRTIRSLTATLGTQRASRDWRRSPLSRGNRQVHPHKSSRSALTLSDFSAGKFPYPPRVCRDSSAIESDGQHPAGRHREVWGDETGDLHERFGGNFSDELL